MTIIKIYIFLYFKLFYENNLLLYLMRQNFEPSIWGPHAWFFLETVAMAYPTNPTFNEKKAAEKFFKSLTIMIPCEKCRNNYKKHIKKYPIDDNVLKSRDNLFKWIVDIHNSVDPKKQRTYDETFNYYMDKYGFTVVKKKNNKITINKKFIILSILIFIILVIFTEIYKILKKS